MPAATPLYQQIEAQIKTVTAPHRVRASSVTRLALLVTGILAAKSCVLSQVAAELDALGLTAARGAAHIGRRLRRTLNDARLTVQTCYQPALVTMLAWEEVAATDGRLVLALDESSHTDRFHLLRLSLTYRGTAIPLAWALWEQNQPLAPGQYWAYLDQVLAEVAQVLPLGIPVVVVADRAYDVVALVDRLSALGWSWVIRLKANGQTRFVDRTGREWAVRDLLIRHVPSAGRRWKGRGQLFKSAGWRPASIVALWARGQGERLAVITDQPPVWHVLGWYSRRFWIEPSFRTDKRKGWQWEHSQVRELVHQECLVLAMAWASLVSVCLGEAQAQTRVQAVQDRPTPPRPGRRPQHARDSLFTLGVQAVRAWLYGCPQVPLHWRLTGLTWPSWTAQWQALHRWQPFTLAVRP